MSCQLTNKNKQLLIGFYFLCYKGITVIYDKTAKRGRGGDAIL